MRVARKAVSFAAAVSIALSGCALQSHGPRPGQLKLGMVTDVGGLGDRSFNDSAYRGLLASRERFGAYIQVLQSRSAADYQPNLTALTNLRFNMIYAIGVLMSNDLAEVASANPSQRYAIIDGDPSAFASDPNVVAVTFKEEDGSFLAGALAAMMSPVHHIAFLGGEDLPLIEKFEAGYAAGAREIDPSTKVDVKYVGSFDDVAAGQEMTQLLFDGGADIVYAAAGKATLGAIGAVKTRPPGTYVIGVDSDQDALLPGKILTSMVKKVYVAVFDIARAANEHRPLHGHIVLGLKQHAIGLTDFRFTRGEIGAARLKRLAAIEKAIELGSIIPPDTPAKAASFKPVNVP